MESLQPIIKNCKYLQQVFCDIPKQIENKIVGKHKSVQDYFINPIENTFNLDPTRTEEVEYYITTLENNKKHWSLRHTKQTF